MAIAFSHENAKFLAEGLAEIPGIRIDPAQVVTNILVFDVSGTGLTAFDLSRRLKEQNVLANGLDAKTMRMVTHCDVDRDGCARTLAVMNQILGARRVAV